MKIAIENVLIPKEGDWEKRNVVIENGIFVSVSESKVKHSEDAAVIQGKERYLIPAFVDPHVHVREPGFAYKEDWETCSKAALRGGFSAIFDMPNNKVPVVNYKVFIEKKEIALNKSYINFGLYIALTDKNIDEIMDDGVQDTICGIKVYLSKTTGGLTVSSEDALLRVFNQPKPVLVHTGGIEGLESILFFYQRASRRFKNLPILYLCHASTGEEVALIRKWKKRFSTILAEVTPHHLFLDSKSYKGYKAVLPPLSSRGDIDLLWEGINDGTIDLLGTDHAPHTVEDRETDNPPSGFPGLETALPLLFTAYKEGKISLKDFIGLTSGRARGLFKMGGGEGISAKQRAECVLLEEGEFLLGEEGYTTKCGWSPFHGWKIGYKPLLTIMNGCIAYDTGKFHKNPVQYLCS